jgi:Flp pilus assembly protein TadG
MSAEENSYKQIRVSALSRMDCVRHMLAEEGQAALELALSLPAMLLIVVGMLTFGIAINNYMLLTNGTSVGARSLAISRGQTLDPCSVASTAMITASPLLKKANLTFVFTLNGTTYSGTSCSSANNSTGAAANLSQGTTATMHVSYPCNLNLYGVPIAKTCVMNAQSSELVQ